MEEKLFRRFQYVEDAELYIDTVCDVEHTVFCKTYQVDPVTKDKTPRFYYVVEDINMVSECENDTAILFDDDIDNVVAVIL